MGKVLISFIGGPARERSKYSMARYDFGGSCVQETTSITEAIVRAKNIDKVFLFGTVGSMWDEIYYKFSTNKNIYDEDVYSEIYEHCCNSDYNSELTVPHKEKIEESLGGGSKIYLLKYGLNEEEFEYNSNIVLGIEKELSKGDELYLDITHSFRSIPVYVMTLVMYLRQASTKKIKIKSISYGMAEMQKTLNASPVTDLKSTLTINDWISAAYAFSEFGNAEKIVKLLKKDRNEDAAKKLEKFSNMLSINYITGIKQVLHEIQAINYDKLSPIAKMVIEPVISDFVSSIGSDKRVWQIILNLAKWHFDKKHYAAAYICLTEAVVKRYASVNNVGNNKAKEIISRDKKDGISQAYREVNKYRIAIAHQTDSRACTDPDIIIKTFSRNYNLFVEGFREDIIAK